MPHVRPVKHVLLAWILTAAYQMEHVFVRVHIMELQVQQVLLHAVHVNQAAQPAQQGLIALYVWIQTQKLYRILAIAKVVIMEAQVQQLLLRAFTAPFNVQVVTLQVAV